MKLPEITYNLQVQRMGARSPFLPVSRAATRVFAAKAVSAAAQATTAISTDIYNRQIKMEVDKAVLDWEQNETALLEEHANKTEYGPGEIPDSMQTHPGRVSSRKGYEVKPEVLRDARIQKLEELTGSITDADAAANFRQAGMERITKQHTKDLLVAQGEQQAAHQILQADIIQEFTQKGNYEAAREVARNFADPTKRKALIFGIDKMEETDPMYESMMGNDATAIVEMEAHMAVLKNPEYEGTLTANQRQDLVFQMERRIYQIQEGSRESRTEQDQLTRDFLDGIIKTLKTGTYNYSPMQLEEFKDQARTLSKGSKRYLNKIDSGIAVGRITAELGFMSPAQRAEWELASRKQATKQPEYAAIHLEASKSIAEMNAQEMRDPVGFNTRIGLIPEVVLDTQSPQAFEQSLMDMKKNADVIYNRKGINGRLMSDAQLNSLNEWVSRMTPQELPQFYATVKSGLGESAGKLFDQMAAAGLKSNTMEAGAVYSQGGDGPQVAQMITEGARIRSRLKSNKIDDELHDKIQQAIGITYINEAYKNNNVIEAIKNVYWHQLKEEGNLVPLVVKQDSVDLAVKRVTGGLVTYNGRTLAPPKRGMSQDQFEDYMDTLSVRTVRMMGNPDGFNFKESVNKLQSGEWELETIGENSYGVWDTTSNGWVMNKNTGGAFIFKYIEDAPRGDRYITPTQQRGQDIPGIPTGVPPSTKPVPSAERYTGSVPFIPSF